MYFSMTVGGGVMLYVTGNGKLNDSKIEEAYIEVDENIREQIEHSYPLDQEQEIFFEKPEAEHEPQVQSDLYEVHTEEDIEYENQEENSEDPFKRLKKYGYYIKSKIEHDIYEMTKSLNPKIQEDKESEYQNRSIPRHFCRI